MSQAPDTTMPEVPPVPVQACTRCGSPVEEHEQFCQACGLKRDLESAPSPTPVDKVTMRCENCGAEIVTDRDHRSISCPFCDTNYVVEFSPEVSNRQRPEFVIGFAVSPDAAREKFHQWLTAGGLFRPSDLRLARIEGKLQGVYLPFWSFSMLAQSRWSASIGEYWYRTETYTTLQNGKLVTRTRRVRETEWWNLGGNHHRDYHAFMLSASRGLPQTDAARIEPFQLAAVRRYEPALLAGWQCEEYSIDRDEALKRCQQELSQRERAATERFLPGDTHGGLSVSTTFDSVSSDLVLLPLYLAAYRYRDKTYRFLLNGQTGKVAGDKPLSKRRIAAAVTTVLVVVAIVVILVMVLGR